MKLVDRVRETTSSTGTGNLTLSGAVAGYQAFSSAYVDGEAFTYAAANATQWETGLGRIVSGALVRDQVYGSSNTNALVNFSSAPTVTVAPLARQSPDIGTTFALSRGMRW